MTGLWIALGVLALLIVIFIGIYNRLVALKQSRINAFSDIDVQLNLRYDLIPNLVETVKGYAGHEKELLENVTNARSRAMGGNTVDEKVEANNLLSGALANLFAVAENYPDLKADSNFLELQRELSDVENKIAAARRFFNNATNEYNTAIKQFPAIIIAGPLNFSEEPYFELAEDKKEAIQEPPKVDFG